MANDLRIQEVRLAGFRNYRSLALGDIGGLTIFVGPNATGKSNVVEGIQLLCAHGSFRSARGRDLIMWGAPFARLEARFVSDSRDLSVATVIEPASRSYTLNGKRRAAQDLQGILPAVAFSPDDLELAKGSQTPKRSAIDLLGSQLSKNHRVIRRDYEKLLRNKNALLKDEATDVLIDSVNDALIPVAARLHMYRVALFRNLCGRMARVYGDITDGAEELSYSYIPSWLSEDFAELAESRPYDAEMSKDEVLEATANAMFSRRLEERARHRAVVGPHADHMEFFIDGRNARTFASQGQQRSIALAWKIAEVELVKKMLGVKPVLLLDDVMSELDARRRGALVDLLHEDIQTFMTATDLTCFEDDIVDRASVLDLSKAGVRA